MAEVLINAITRVHKDPIKDRIGAHKRGEITIAQRDGFIWGTREGPPRFGRLHLPGIKSDFINSRYSCFANPEIQAGEIYRRARWVILDDEMPSELREKVYPAIYVGGKLPMIKIRPRPSSVGTWDITWEDFRNYFFDHQTGYRETREIPDVAIVALHQK